MIGPLDRDQIHSQITHEQDTEGEGNQPKTYQKQWSGTLHVDLVVAWEEEVEVVGGIYPGP